MRTRSLLTAAGAALALAVTPTASAAAAPSFDPAAPKTANPAQTCAFVAGYAGMFGVSYDVSHSTCVRTIAGSVPTVAAGDPMMACAAMEAAGEVSYPYAFYADAPPGMGFPGLVAHDRTQCARALWAFHTLVTLG